MEFFRIRFVGINSENLHKLSLTLALVVAVIALRYVVGPSPSRLRREHEINVSQEGRLRGEIDFD